MSILDYEKLNKEKRNIPDKFEPLRLRIHRAISWGKRAEQETNDIDARFIFFWIGFNSLYSKEPELDDGKGDSTHSKKSQSGDNKQTPIDTFDELQEYLNVLVPLNSKLIHETFWKGTVFQAGVSLMEDEYLYKSFWKAKTAGDKHERWRKGMESDKRKFIQARSLSEIQRKKIPEIFTSTIFRRLCVLRNQVIHGSATHKSNLNRKALRRGVRVLEKSLPVFIGLMIENQDKCWGIPRYLPK